LSTYELISALKIKLIDSTDPGENVYVFAIIVKYSLYRVRRFLNKKKQRLKFRFKDSKLQK